MKFLSIQFSIILISIVAFGQKDSFNFNKDNYTSNKIKFSESQDHFMLNFTLDNMRSSATDSNYKSKAFNPNMGIYFMYDMPIGKNGISFAPGLGVTFSKVNLNNCLLAQDTTGSKFTLPSNITTFQDLNKVYQGSSFYTSWVEIPMELRYKTKPINGRSCFKIAAGMRFGMKLGSNSTYSYNDYYLSREIKIKESSFADLNSVRYGLTFRVGYGAINLFGYYGLNDFFKSTKNPSNSEIKQYSIGISITGM